MHAFNCCFTVYLISLLCTICNIHVYKCGNRGDGVTNKHVCEQWGIEGSFLGGWSPLVSKFREF